MPSNRYKGSSKLPILIVILILCAAGVVLKKHLQQAEEAPAAAAKSSPKPFVVTAAARPRGSVVYLRPYQISPRFSYRGMMTLELFRQALLIAGREGLGLQTRDASLREWDGDAPPQNALELDYSFDKIDLRDVDKSTDLWWTSNFPYDGKSDQTDVLIASLEQLSRGDFIDALHKAGWSGQANAPNPDAAAPADSETRLDDLEEINQFDLLRETHALIHKDGESLPRLSVLVRAYANLGSLTRYHWSHEYAVYTARSLLYAQRMVARNPHSAFALWNRAYARALGGFQADAMKDLAAAAQLNGETPPAWVSLLPPYCNYETQTLMRLAKSDPKLAPLGSYMAFLTAEVDGSQAALMTAAIAAYTANPRCMRVLDAMCEQTGPGTLPQIVDTSEKIFGQTLGSKLENLPDFPPLLTHQIESFKRPGGNKQGRVQICEELIQQAAPPAADVDEPSWAALGRLIQETTFEQVRQHAILICERWGSDASDYVNTSRPLFKDHPWACVIETYGVKHDANLPTLRRTLNEPPETAWLLTTRQSSVYYLELNIQTSGPTTERVILSWIAENTDYSSNELEAAIQFWNNQPGGFGVDQRNHLRRISPASPIVITSDIESSWDADKAVKWEADHGENPSVALALGKKYTDLKRWPDAVRCLRKYIALSPDDVGYWALVQVYKDQNDDANTLATWQECLAKTEDYGLQHARIRVQIANFLMEKRGDYQAALPYADAAANTGSAWGMLCAADAHTGTGDFNGAQQLLLDEKQSYTESPFDWYVWCNHTCHGDMTAAKKELLDYFTEKGNDLNERDLLQQGCVAISEGDLTDATVIFQRRESLYPKSASEMYLALLADEQTNTAFRDQMLDQFVQNSFYGTTTRRFSQLLQSAYQSGSDARLDAGSLESILLDSTNDERVTFLAIAARFLEDHHRSDEAVAYLKRADQIKSLSADRVLVDAALRAKNLDPWTLDTASHSLQSATRPSP